MLTPRRLLASLAAAAVIAVGPLVAPLHVSATPANGTMLTLAWDSGEMFSVNPSDASLTSVGTSTLLGSAAIAWSAEAQTLYGTDYDSAEPSLFTIDPDTAVATVVGPLGVDGPTGLDVQPGTGALFMVYDASATASTLATVNPTTAMVTDIGPVREGKTDLRISGIAFNPADSKLYGFNYDSDLYEIDPATGAATLLHSGVFNGYGVSFDCEGNLWATSAGGDHLAQIDIATGVATVKGTMGPGDYLFENLTVICGVPVAESTTTTATPTTTAPTPTSSTPVAAVTATPKFTG